MKTQRNTGLLTVHAGYLGDGELETNDVEPMPFTGIELDKSSKSLQDNVADEEDEEENEEDEIEDNEEVEPLTI
jgi:hypothetical protein